MRKVLNCFICILVCVMMFTLDFSFDEKARAAEIPVDYASACALYEQTDYIVSGNSIYLIMPYVLATGQQWSFRQRSSANVAYESNLLFTESGENIVGNKAVILFKFDASSAGIFRIALYLTEGGILSGEPYCYNFVVSGNETDGFKFAEQYEESEYIPLDYAQAQSMKDLTIDGDLAIFCIDESEDTYSATISSSFTWESVLSVFVPKQSVSEYALDDGTEGFKVIVLRITSAGTGTFKLTNSDSTQTIEYPLSAAVSDGGTVTVNDERIVYGDVNSDGKVNAIDATIIARASVGKITFTEIQTTAADVNGDGNVNALDATMVARYSVGKLSAFPVG